MKLTDYLATHEMSKREFAEKIGVTEEAVRLYVKGARYPKYATMRKIMDATDGKVGPYDFMDRTEVA